MATNSANSKILKRGTYTIRSMAFPLNSAHLKSNVDHGFVTASPNDDSDSYKWVIEKLDDERYTIQNLNTGQFTCVEREHPEGIAPDLITSNRKPAEHWKIVQTKKTGVFRIGTESGYRNELFYWRLAYGNDGTQIRFGDYSKDQMHYWYIEPMAAAAAASVPAPPALESQKNIHNVVPPGIANSRLESGIYTIVNALYFNTAHLASDTEGELLKARDDKGTDYYKWNITKLSNNRYTMQNRQTKQFAYVGPDARGEREMIEAWAEHEKEWEIFGAGTADVFRIAYPEYPNRYWGLSSIASGTPVVLRGPNTDRANQWDISRA